jgi:hypothetical protein
MKTSRQIVCSVLGSHPIHFILSVCMSEQRSHGPKTSVDAQVSNTADVPVTITVCPTKLCQRHSMLKKYSALADRVGCKFLRDDNERTQVRLFQIFEVSKD